MKWTLILCFKRYWIIYFQMYWDAFIYLVTSLMKYHWKQTRMCFPSLFWQCLLLYWYIKFQRCNWRKWNKCRKFTWENTSHFMSVVCFSSQIKQLVLLHFSTWLCTIIRIILRVALKVMPLILLCWPTISKVDVSGMAVEVKPSHQYSITFCCCLTDGSLTKGSLTWECIWSNNVELNSSTQKKKKWHPLTFIDTGWMLMETKQWLWAPWGGEWCTSATEIKTVDQLCWFRVLQAWHEGFCSLEVKMHS